MSGSSPIGSAHLSSNMQYESYFHHTSFKEARNKLMTTAMRSSRIVIVISRPLTTDFKDWQEYLDAKREVYAYFVPHSEILVLLNKSIVTNSQSMGRNQRIQEFALESAIEFSLRSHDISPAVTLVTSTEGKSMAKLSS
jgi:hypothetical protein